MGLTKEIAASEERMRHPKTLTGKEVAVPKISEDSPKLFRRPDERFRTFSENFRRCLKIAEDFRGRPEDVSMIHQRIQVQFKRQT